MFFSQKKVTPGGVAEMFAIAFPMLVSHACETVMTFTDRLFLSKLGPEVMNAAMGGGLMCFTMMTFFIGIIGYSTALTAQFLGSKQKAKCSKVLTQAVILAIAASPLILFCRPLAHLMFEKMGIAAEQLVHQKVYFNILLSAVVLGLLRTSFSSFFSGIGRTFIVMCASFTAMIVNVGFNYIFIFGKFGFPAMGIRGAAFGTILGTLTGLLMLVISYFSYANRKEFSIAKSLRFDWQIMKPLLRFGYPAGLEMFLNLMGFSLMIMTFHTLNLETAVAATIMFNWDMVSFVPLIGIEIAVTSLVGRYVGARKHDIAHRSVFSGLKMGWVYSAVIFVMFCFFPHMLVNVFRPDVNQNVFLQAVPTAVFMVRAASLYVLIEAIFVVFIGALRGAGDTFAAMCLSVTLHLFLVPILYVMMHVLDISPEISWFAVIGTFFLFSGIVFARYKSGKWKEISIVGAEAPVVIHDDFHEHVDL